MSRRLVLGLAVFLGWFSTSPGLADDRPASKRSFAFLELGAGPRAYALGESFSGLADDLTALSWNPAGLSQVTDPQVSFMHNQWILNLRQEYLAAAQPLAGGVAGVQVSYVNADQQLIRDDDGLLTGGSFHPYSVYASGAYARPVGQGFSVGVGVGYAQEQLAGTVYQTVCGDVGAYYRLADAPWSLGASIQHAGWPVAGYPLPLALRLGAAARLWDEAITVTAEISRVIPGWFRYGAGVEYWYQNVFAFRAGYLWRPENDGLGAWAGLRAGVGFNIQGYQMDYALIPQGDLGLGHRASFTYFFGGGRTLVSEKTVLTRRARELGQAALAAGRFTEAVNQFQRVLSFLPDDSVASAGLAAAQTGLRQQELAQEIQNRLRQAAAFRREGQLPEAIDEYERILLREPGQAEAVRLLAQTQHEHNAAAIDRYLTQGRQAFRSQQWADALLAWQAVLSLDGGHAEAKRQLAATRAEMAKGVKGFTDPRIKEWYLEGLKLFEQGDYHGASLKWSKVLQKAPSHQQAKRYLKQALRLIETKVAELLSAAERQRAAGDWVRAAASWRGVFRFSPKHPQARRQLREHAAALKQRAKERYLQGIEAYTQGRWPEAIASWQDVLTLVPEYPGAQDNIDKAREKIKAMREPGPEALDKKVNEK